MVKIKLNMTVDRAAILRLQALVRPVLGGQRAGRAEGQFQKQKLQFATAVTLSKYFCFHLFLLFILFVSNIASFSGDAAEAAPATGAAAAAMTNGDSSATPTAEQQQYYHHD